MVSSYYVQINMSVRRGTSKALAYIVYIRERYSNFLCVHFKRVLIFFDVKVDVQKGIMRFGQII